MKAVLLSLLACLSLLVSCSEKGADAPAPAAPCQLSEIRNKGGEEIWQQLTYDTEGRPASYLINDARTFTRFKVSVTYNEAGRRKEVLSEWINGPVEDRKRTVYRYNTAGAIDTVYLHHLNGADRANSPTVFVHIYNQQNQLTEIRQKITKDGRLEDMAVFRYFYEGNQLSRREDFAVGHANNRAIYHLQFDNKKRPDQIGIVPHLSGLDDYYYLCDFLMPGQRNLTSFRIVSATTGETFPMGSFTSTYTYNKDGYPVYQETKYLTGEEKVFTFSYNCQ